MVHLNLALRNSIPKPSVAVRLAVESDPTKRVTKRTESRGVDFMLNSYKYYSLENKLVVDSFRIYSVFNI